jgi:hypothetical protein
LSAEERHSEERGTKGKAETRKILVAKSKSD